MSANVETMFYVNEDGSSRNVPWHGLGTSVKSAPTSEDALYLAGLDWDVLSEKVYVQGKAIDGYRANVRETDGAILGLVGERYKIVQNKEAFDFTDALVGEGCTYETAGSLFGGKRVWLLAKMDTTKILGDDVEPYICFTNGHDGRNTIKACLTPTRVVCNNTLNMALKNAKRNWSTRHVGDLKSKMEEAKRTLQLADEYMKELAVVAEKLADTKISDDEVRSVLDTIYPVAETDSERKIANAEAAKDNIMACLNAPDISQFKGTAWGVVNAASDFVSHVAPARKTDTFQENNFNKILDGHVVFDAITLAMMAKVAKSKVSA